MDCVIARAKTAFNCTKKPSPQPGEGLSNQTINQKTLWYFKP